MALVTAVPTTRLAVTAVSEKLDSPADLLAALASPTGTLCFLRGGEGFVGWGVHERFSATGADAAQQIQRWFAEVSAGIRVDDRVGLPGSGPIAFVSLGFRRRRRFGRDRAEGGDGQVRRNVVRHQDRWRPATGTANGSGRRSQVRAPGRVSYADADLSVAGFTTAVAAPPPGSGPASCRRSSSPTTSRPPPPAPVDERFLLSHLSAAYPDCWTFAVEGLVGASPELLIRRTGAAIASRVLAGTAWKEHSGDAVSAGLLGSAKDIVEHAYAVQSVADVLARATVDLDVPSAPVPLELANLTHLSTDITGRLDDRAPTALELAARLHPTAAVGGSPTDVARQVIRELEPMRRGRYAAPVGWMDSRGDGEFAIALRCAQVQGRSVRLIAGCGILADSDPEIEAREAQIKMIPIRDALEARS